MSSHAVIPISFVLSLSLLSGCSEQNKNTYLLDQSLSLHQYQAEDTNSYAYISFEQDKEQLGAVRYAWRNPTNILETDMPGDMLTIKYLVEENNLSVSSKGYIHSRFFGQNDQNELILYGFETNEGTFWLKNTENNSYGLTFITNDLLIGEEQISHSANIESCELACNTVGSFTLTIDFVTKHTGDDLKETPYGFFETIELDVNGSVSVTALGEVNNSFDYNFIEKLFIYPQTGVVHRQIVTSGFEGIDIDMKLNDTNIPISEDLIVEPSS